jgi:tetratricopeptide (TPR) repeat protein
MSKNLHDINITCKPLNNFRYALPKSAATNMEDLCDLVENHTDIAIVELEYLIDEYPQAAILYNYLAAAYRKANRHEDADALVEQNYLLHSDYLFAQIDYGSLCLSKGFTHKVADMFTHKFDLRDLYPDRDVFHIIEVMNFYGLIGAYYAALGEIGQAQYIHEYLHDLAPYHPIAENLKQAIQQRLKSSYKKEVSLLIFGVLTSIVVIGISLAKLFF